MYLEQKNKILIVEDEPVLLRSLIFTLRRFQYQVKGLSTGSDVIEALTRPECDNYQLLITDIQLPGITGLELIDKIKAMGMVIPALVITAYGDQSVISELQKRNIKEYLTKPFSMEDLILRVDRILKAAD